MKSESDGHPYYVGVQYHPEFKSRPGRPSPPFLGLLLASSGQALPGILTLESHELFDNLGAISRIAVVGIPSSRDIPVSIRTLESPNNFEGVATPRMESNRWHGGHQEKVGNCLVQSEALPTHR